jgi:hypothetical protein
MWGPNDPYRRHIMAKYMTVGDCMKLVEDADGCCHWCGINVVQASLGAGKNSTTASLDRISNGVCHIRGNVVLSCWGCNSDRGSVSYHAYREHLDAKKRLEDSIIADVLADYY